MFYKKYENLRILDSILHKLRLNFFNKNNTWYEGNNLFAPSTNNSLENFNRILKDKYFNWKKNDLLQLIKNFEIVLNDLSLAYVNNHPNFVKKMYDENEFYETNDFDFKLIHKGVNENKYLVIKNDTKLSEEQLMDIKNSVINNDINDFKTFERFIKEFIVLTVSSNLESFKEISCTCFTFLKRKACKHILRYLKENKKEDLVDLVLMKVNNKRGRPKKIVKRNSLNKN